MSIQSLEKLMFKGFLAGFIAMTVMSNVLFCPLGYAMQSPSNVPGLDAGAILARDRWMRMNPWYFNGPVNIDDLKPKDPVIIDEFHILPDKYHREVHGIVLPDDLTPLSP